MCACECVCGGGRRRGCVVWHAVCMQSVFWMLCVAASKVVRVCSDVFVVVLVCQWKGCLCGVGDHGGCVQFVFVFVKARG